MCDFCGATEKIKAVMKWKKTHQIHNQSTAVKKCNFEHSDVKYKRKII